MFREAFSFHSARAPSNGASVWLALRYGLARGDYANEAGYGTAAVATGATAHTAEQQGLNAVMEVFIISITSTISAMSILLTGVWRSGPNARPPSPRRSSRHAHGGGWMVAVSVFLFGYTTLIGWAFYGEQFLEYLSAGKKIITPYRWISTAFSSRSAPSRRVSSCGPGATS